jgi:hypothetical protein
MARQQDRRPSGVVISLLCRDQFQHKLSSIPQGYLRCCLGDTMPLRVLNPMSGQKAGRFLVFHPDFDEFCTLLDLTALRASTVEVVDSGAFCAINHYGQRYSGILLSLQLFFGKVI